MSEKQRARLEELLQQEVPAHEGEAFIAEPDLRALPSFKKGEVNDRAAHEKLLLYLQQYPR